MGCVATLSTLKKIVAVQQNYARRGGITEVMDIRELVEDSLQLNKGSFSRHGVAVFREFEDVPRLQVDKHKVLQILVNVIRNAKYACDELPGGEKRVTVRVRRDRTSPCWSKSSIRASAFHLRDLGRIFNHGFTTPSTAMAFRAAQQCTGGKGAGRNPAR